MTFVACTREDRVCSSDLVAVLSLVLSDPNGVERMIFFLGTSRRMGFSRFVITVLFSFRNLFPMPFSVSKSPSCGPLPSLVGALASFDEGNRPSESRGSHAKSGDLSLFFSPLFSMNSYLLLPPRARSFPPEKHVERALPVIARLFPPPRQLFLQNRPAPDPH